MFRQKTLHIIISKQTSPDMRKIFFLIIVFITIGLSSCSIYEDITFKQNGQTDYNLTIDASELVVFLSGNNENFMNSIPSDTIISFDEIIKQEIGQENIPEDRDKELNALRRMKMKIESSEEDEILKMKISGNFNDVSEMNTALAFIEKTNNKKVNNANESDTDNESEENIITEKKSGDIPEILSNVGFSSHFAWDGKNMQRTVDEKSLAQKGRSTDKATKKMMDHGKYTVRYHFEKKIKKISNPNAQLSEDGKSVTIEYTPAAFYDASDALNIEIEL